MTDAARLDPDAKAIWCEERRSVGLAPFDGLNKSRGKALSVMLRRKSPMTGPMNVQPAAHGSRTPTQSQPMMPSAGKKPNTAVPKKQSTRTEALRAAKAKILRRNSLLKQRQAQKG